MCVAIAAVIEPLFDGLHRQVQTTGAGRPIWQCRDLSLHNLKCDTSRG